MDNAATTRVTENVAGIVKKVMTEDYGNPSSMHQKGVDSEKYLKRSRQIIADSMKVDTKEIFFTSGGTESNNMAIIGAAEAYKRQGKHIITTVMEHASVYNPMFWLEENGYDVSYIGVDSLGHVRLDELEEAIREDTILISVMMVNNEVGAVENISKIAEVIKNKNPRTVFHVDAIQAYGKYKIYPGKLGIDMMSVSGHKIHGPKGSGFLYVRDKIKLRPLMWGGGQEKGMRSGTENVPAIAGLGQAVEDFYTAHSEKIERLYGLKKDFISAVLELNGEDKDTVTVNAVDLSDLSKSGLLAAVKKTAPHIVSVSFKNIRSEVLLHALEERGVYVSSGSACSSNHPQISGTLKAIGVKKELLDSTLRFSFSTFTTYDEIMYAVEALKELVPIYSRYVRH